METSHPQAGHHTPTSRGAQLRAVLRTRTALGQAIVLAEILAPPLTMRSSRVLLSRRASRPSAGAAGGSRPGLS